MGVCDSEGREAGTVVWCTALYSSPEQQASSVRQSQTGLLFSHYNINYNTGVTLCQASDQHDNNIDTRRES